MTVLLYHRGTALAAHCLWRAQKKARLAIDRGDWIITQDALDTIDGIARHAKPGSALARHAASAAACLVRAVQRTTFQHLENDDEDGDLVPGDNAPRNNAIDVYARRDRLEARAVAAERCAFQDDPAASPRPDNPAAPQPGAG